MSRHLVHIGFPKAGSTSLGAWFAAHPQLAYTPNGIGGHHGAFEIAARAADRDARTPAWYVTSSESLSAPRLSDQPSLQDRAESVERGALEDSRRRVCSALHALFPGATILIVTRGFRGALASSYAQYVRSGGRASMGELFWPAAEALVGYFDYDGVVSLYRETFGPERVIVLPYELLRDEPESFVRTLEGCLGLEPSGTSMPARNRAPSAAAIAWYRSLSILVAPAAGVLGGRVGGRLWRRYVSRLRADGSHRLADRLGTLTMRPTAGLAEVPDEIVVRLRGRAAVLGRHPLYAPYAADYLNAHQGAANAMGAAAT